MENVENSNKKYQTRIDNLAKKANSVLKKRYQVDLNSYLKDSSISNAEKQQKLLGEIKTSVIETGVDPKLFDSLALNVTSIPDCVAAAGVLTTREKAFEIANETGDNIKAFIETAEVYLQMTDEDADPISLANTAISVGVLGAGGFMATQIAAVFTAGSAVLAGGGTVAAAEAAIIAAAASANFTIATGTATTIGAGIASGGAIGTLQALAYTAGAFICSPIGAIVIGAVIVVVLAALIFYLASRPRSVAGVIVNNTTGILKLHGGNPTVNGIYSEGNDSGSMTNFPGLYSEDEKEEFQYYGVRNIQSDNLDSTSSSDYMVEVGIFIFENESGSATGYFSMSDDSNNSYVFLISNRRGPHKSTVYLASDPLTDSADDIYKKYYGLSSQHSVNTSSNGKWQLVATVNEGWSGTDAYSVFYLGSPIS